MSRIRRPSPLQPRCSMTEDLHLASSWAAPWPVRPLVDPAIQPSDLREGGHCPVLPFSAVNGLPRLRLRFLRTKHSSRGILVGDAIPPGTALGLSAHSQDGL